MIEKMSKYEREILEAVSLNGGKNMTGSDFLGLSEMFSDPSLPDNLKIGIKLHGRLLMIDAVAASFMDDVGELAVHTVPPEVNETLRFRIDDEKLVPFRLSAFLKIVKKNKELPLIFLGGSFFMTRVEMSFSFVVFNDDSKPRKSFPLPSWM